jgi:hypothetical protein
MKRALPGFALLATLLLATAATPDHDAPHRGKRQVIAIDVTVLRHEWQKGWQHSFYVHLGDTWASFVTHQLGHLGEGQYTDVVPEIRSEVESFERAQHGPTRQGGWEPLGWSDCEHDLILLTRPGERP